MTRRITPRAALVGAAVAAASLGTAAIVGAQSGPDKVAAVQHAIDDGRPKNVIMLLGDGMGDSEISAARYTFAGAGGHLNMDAFPFTGEQTTWSVKPGAGPALLPDYVPDSASTGTAWATGTKTIDERISQGPSTALDVPGSNGLPTVLEQAQKAGMTTGDVSTAEITDATPAVMASHISNRGCQGPADTRTLCPGETKAAGGLGSIAEQMVDHRVDVILGGGKGRFDQPLADGGTETVTDYAQSDQGYKLVTDAGGLAGVDDLRQPVLGLFTKGNMSLEWSGPDAQTQQADGTYGPAVTCARDQRPANEPSLSDMTTKALSLLEQRGKGKGKGFFLQVEGASIDKRDHAANPCQQIGETVAFDKAIGVALAYQRAHPDTLVVLTADHGHTSQIVAEDTNGEDGPTGYAEDLVTKDGQKIRIAYGTAGGLTRPPAAEVSQQHTGTEVRIAAVGPQAARVNGVIDETDINGILTSFQKRGGKG